MRVNSINQIQHYSSKLNSSKKITGIDDLKSIGKARIEQSPDGSGPNNKQSEFHLEKIDLDSFTMALE